MTRWKKAVGVVAAVMVVVSLTACSGSTRTKGGDTTCGEYLTMSSDDQYEAVKDLLSEKGKTPSKAMIQLSVSSAKLFCVTAGDDQSKIREIIHLDVRTSERGCGGHPMGGPHVCRASCVGYLLIWRSSQALRSG